MLKKRRGLRVWIHNPAPTQGDTEELLALLCPKLPSHERDQATIFLFVFLLSQYNSVCVYNLPKVKALVANKKLTT